MSDVDLGNIFYGIYANDNSQEGLTGAITSASIAFDFINQAAQTMKQYVQEAYDDTTGAAVDFSSQMIKTSDSTGVSTDNLQRLRAGAMAVGVDFDIASQSLRMFSQKIDETGTAGNTLRSRLSQVGVSVTDSNGNMKDTYSIYTQTIEKLGEMPNTMERNNLALAIFGRSWASIAPLMTDYKTVAGAAASADPIPQDTLEKTRQFGINLDEAKNKLSMVGISAGTELVPALNNVVSIFSSGFSNGSPIMTFFSWLNGALEESTEGFAKLVGGIEAGTIAVADLTEGKGLTKAMADFQGQEDKTNAYITSLRGQFDEMSNVNQAQQQSNDQTQQQVDTTAQLTQATNDYSDALTKEEDMQKSINELTSNYLEDMADTGRDVSQAKSLTKSYRRSLQKDTGELATDKANMTKYGDIIIQLDGKTLAKIPEVAAAVAGTSFTAAQWTQKLSLTQKGIS